MAEVETAAPTVQKSDEQQTQADSKLVPEIPIKHPLQNTWDLWYYKNVSNDFEKNLFQITSVESVEDFWGLYNHIEIASRLTPNCAYYFFKKGIRPMWEDYTNKNGGRWVINNNKKNKQTDSYWLEILLSLIGEAFGEYNDSICGAFVVIKPKNDRIGVWTKQSTDKDANMLIGQTIKNRTQYMNSINYESHDSSKKICYAI